MQRGLGWMLASGLSVPAVYILITQALDFVSRRDPVPNQGAMLIAVALFFAWCAIAFIVFLFGLVMALVGFGKKRFDEDPPVN